MTSKISKIVLSVVSILIIYSIPVIALEYQNIKFDIHNIHFLKLDPKKEKIRLIKALEGKIGTENLLDIVDRHNAIEVLMLDILNLKVK